MSVRRSHFLFIVCSLLLPILFLHSPSAAFATPVLWDDLNSQPFYGTDWANDVTTSWVTFQGREALKADVATGAENWALMHSGSFPFENWEGVSEVQGVVYRAGGSNTSRITLELRAPDFNTVLIDADCDIPIASVWQSCTWVLPSAPDLSQISYLSFVFDNVYNASPSFYFDSLSVVRNGQLSLWDDFNDGGRDWFPFGHNVDFNPGGLMERSLITHNHVATGGALYLLWEYDSANSGTSAEIGTANVNDVAWQNYQRLRADVRISDPAAPLSLFFWDADVGAGFGSGTQFATAADTWQTLTWDIPWPNDFDATSLDEMKFIIGEVDVYQSGELYIDNIMLLTNDEPVPLDGTEIVIDSFDDQELTINNLNAASGLLDYGSVEFPTNSTPDGSNAALAFSYDMPPDSFSGFYEIMFGDADDVGRSLDFSKGDRQIHLWVRGSGNSANIHNVKIELKDSSGEFAKTAYRYIRIDDSDTTWRRIILDGDVTNADFWSYNGVPPDPTKMKQLVFVVESAFNNSTGTFLVDNIHFVVDTPQPLDGLLYLFQDFNDNREDILFNHFQGNWGLLNADYIVKQFLTDVRVGTWGYGLQLSYDMTAEPANPDEAFTGIWQSLWGHSDAIDQTLDFSDIFGDLLGLDRDFEQLRFKVRGSGTCDCTHIVKIELKDSNGAFDETAWRYIFIDDRDTEWREIVLDADVSNAEFWSYNDTSPDPTKMKELVFALERDLNPASGTFYIDDIHFVDADDTVLDISSMPDDEFLDMVSQRTFVNFLEWRDPVTGLFQDRSVFHNIYSTAATGFGLTALTVGVERGWLSHDDEAAMVLQALQTLRDGQPHNDPAQSNGQRGFYYHFLNEDGFWDEQSELSSVDTAILIFGMLSVREYFSDNSEIVQLVDQLYDRVEWDWMLQSDEQQFYHGWQPQCNSTNYQIPAPGGGCFRSYDGRPLLWDVYSDETVMIHMLAIGSETYPVSTNTFYSWWRPNECFIIDGETEEVCAITSWDGSFFTYFFAHLYVDFGRLGEDRDGVDWQQNSINAARISKQFVKDHIDDVACDDDDYYTTYHESIVALSAADGKFQYVGWGGEPAAQDPPHHNGTVAPYGSGATIMFLPQEAIESLRYFYTETDTWHPLLGFADAYTFDPPDCSGEPWYGRVHFGIDNGPLLIAIENHRSQLTWHTMWSNPQLQRGIDLIWERHKLYLPIIEK